MVSCSPNSTAVVLDLDDTLYKEVDYQKSGISAVCDLIHSIYGISLEDKLAKFIESDEKDVLGMLCREAGLPASVKESFLWVYRLHSPNITLSVDASGFIDRLKSKQKIIILTDGRSISQRLKLKALGLSNFPVFISEEYESEKPSPLRFELIMKRFPSANYVYIGDNPKKDFIAPRALGWKTFCLRSTGRNIHSQFIDPLAENHAPHYWIDTLCQTLELLDA